MSDAESPHESNRGVTVEDFDPREFVEELLNATETCDWCLAPLFEAYETPHGTAYDPAPEAAQDYFGPTTIDGRRKRGGKKTRCGDCGRADPPAAGENRGKYERDDHLENVLDHLDERVDVDVDREAATDALWSLSSDPVTEDPDAFAAAVEAALPTNNTEATDNVQK